MTSSLNLASARLALSSVAILAMASCELPPREAWNTIQSKGLLTYYLGKDGVQRSSSPSSSQNVASSTITTPKTVIPSTPPPSQLSSSSLPMAKSVPNLPGYVRTPFTNPPRLVDVRGMSSGSKVVCPYTQKPFLVPGGMTSTTSSSVASNSPSRTSVTVPTRTTTTASTTPSKPNPSTPAPSKPTTVASNSPASQPQKQTPPPTQPKLETPAPSIPFGKSIPGRTGFVNSPFAASHQLVDVTGLPVGMEVKCPYTGKLFKVPPQATAQSTTGQ